MAVASIADFSGGQNTVLSPDKLPMGTGVLLRNGNVRGRAVQSIGGLAETGETSPTAFGHYGTAERSAVRWYDRHYWTVNGAVPAYGGSSYAPGIAPLSAAHLAAVTLTPGGAGDLDGEYRYAFTWLNPDGWESAPAGPGETWWRTATASSAANIVLDGFPALPAAGWKMRIYRTIGGGGDFYLAAERSVVTAFTDSTVDNDLLLQPALETQNDHPPPDGGRYLTEVNGVFFAAVGDRLYFSRQGNPHAWPGLNWIGMDAAVTALGEAFGNLAVWTANEFRIVTGAESPATIAQQTIGPQGCPDWRTPAQLREAPVWQSNDGICTWDGSQILLLSSQRVEPPVGELGVVADDCYWLFHSRGALIYDARGPGIWRETDVPCEYAFYAADEDLLCLVQADGWVRSFGGGAPLRFEWRSPVLSGESTLSLKRYVRVRLNSDCETRVHIATDLGRSHTVEIPGAGRREARLPRSLCGAGAQVSVSGVGLLREVAVEFEEGAL